MSNTNRVGEICWYQTKINTEWRRGYLRMWGHDHVEYETGPGHYPVAVVEDTAEKTCHSIYVNSIVFGDKPE